MAKQLKRVYTFAPGSSGVGSVTFSGNYVLSDILLITNTTDGIIIYNFSDSTRGGTISTVGNQTTITLTYNTSVMSSTDALQIYVDSGPQLIEPAAAFRDPVDKARVSNPESLIDTDFEYSLQPTKWETVQLQANIPGLYQKANEPAFTAEQITSILPSTFTTTPIVSSITYDTALEGYTYNTVENRGSLDNADTTNNNTAPLGFNFAVNGYTFNQVRSNAEGVLFFGNNVVNNATGIANPSYGSNPLLKMFGQDMSVLIYQDLTIGTSPNRQYIFKWSGASPGNGSAANLSQVVYVIFLEGQNIIEVHYERNANTGTVALTDPRIPSNILTWAPTTNTDAGQNFITRDAFSLNLNAVTIDGLEITVDVAPTIPFVNGTPIILKETLDPVYLDRAYLITSVSSTTSFNIVPDAPTAYVGDQKTPYTVLYTGGFYYSAELPLTSITTISGSRNLSIEFSTNHSLFLGSTIYVVDSSSTDTDWIGSFVVSRVLSSTSILYEGASTANYGANTVVSSATTRVYVRNNGTALHRYLDGGVQISPENFSPNCQIIRQTRNYFRYQSGKGIQFSTGILFKPTYDVFSVVVDNSSYDATVYPYYDMTITTDQVHGFNLPGTYLESPLINLRGFTVDSGTQPIYNVTNSPILGIDSPKTFSLQIPYTAGVVPPPNLDPGGLAYVEVVGWNDAVVRSGLFDQQNGLFFEHDGDDLWVVKRDSTTQLSGTISINQNESTVVGVSTKFKTQLDEGDFIVIKGVSYYITRITDDTNLTIAPDYIGTSITGNKITKTVEDRVKRENFNLDPVNGTGPSGYIFDPSKMQMVFLDYSWYGAGKVRFGMRGITGDIFYCHEFVNNNSNTEAYLRTGNLPARFEINTVSKRGQLQSAMTAISTNVVVLEEDAAYLPDKGRIIINSEYIEYTKGSVPGAGLRNLTLDNRNVGFLTAGNQTAVLDDTWLSNNQNLSPTLSHWGVSVIMDGEFNVDKSYLFTALNAAPITIATGVTRPILTVRLAPSVDYGIGSFYGVRNLINRSLLTLNKIATSANGQFTITVKINGESTLFEVDSNWQAAGNGSIAQYIDHTTATEVLGGDVIGVFLTDEGVNRGSSSSFDIEAIRGLSNSVLGGPNSFPDGPDTLTIFATNNSSTPSTILSTISWTESQG